MRAVVFHRPRHITVDRIEEPRIVEPTDAVVRVTLTSLCGSDLHIYNGVFPETKPFVLGHEFVGVVEELGTDVDGLRKGDRVVVPCSISCGSCFFCSRSLPMQCERSNREYYGPEGGVLRQKGGGIFGFTRFYGGYPGGQAEYVRVPFANVGSRKIPARLSDEEVLFLGDIAPTGWAALDWCDLRGGETVAIFGSGPVGLMAMKAAWAFGAGRVIAVDVEDYRLDLARGVCRAEVVNARERDPVKFIRVMTEGRGADACIDAVGMDARRSLSKRLASVVTAEVGSIDVLEQCMSAVRRGGVVSVVGFYVTPYNFPVGQLFDKSIRLRMGHAPIHDYIDELLALVEVRKLRTDDIISHRLSLDDAPHAYDIFARKKERCTKVVMKP